jgi:hypothetical protein
MESKLTKYANQHSALNHDILSRKSIEWLQKKVRDLRNPVRLATEIAKEKDRHAKIPVLGGMYFFYYDPKHAKTLPYYDMFPLVLILERHADGFLGLNLHYLPIVLRAVLMDRLLPYASYDDNDDVRRIRVTYDILSMGSTNRYIKPCIKKYLTSNMSTRLLRVSPNEFETALFLPVEQFVKQKKQQVWKESIQQVKEG